MARNYIENPRNYIENLYGYYFYVLYDVVSSVCLLRHGMGIFSNM